jgi:pyridoxine 5-phosphate synthase
VPERRLEVTTEGGLDVVAAEQSLTEMRKKMNDSGIEVSLFIAPDEKQIDAAARTGSQFIELHTGRFSEHFGNSQRELAPSEKSEMDQSRHTSAAPDFEIELQRLISGARQAHALHLKVNAGHGLNYENLPLLNRVPHLVELNIGHSIVSRAALIGMESAVREMLALMKSYQG